MADVIEWGAALEIRSDGRTISGPVVRYGDVAPSFREMFEPEAFASVADPLPVHLEHDRSFIVRPDGSRERVMRRADGIGLELRLGEHSAALKMVRSGYLTGWSPEFVSLAERRESGLRVIERAHLAGVGLVHEPAYKQSRVELRSTKMALMRAGILPQRRNSCECSGRECSYASFTPEALAEEAARINEGADVIAAWGNYSNPLASTSKGTVRVRWQAEGQELGRFDIEIDLPDTDLGRSVVAASEDAGIVVRPFLDPRRSVGQRIGETMAYSAIFTRAFIVSSTDAREGWPEPEIDLSLNEGLLTDEELEAVEQGQRRRVFV